MEESLLTPTALRWSALSPAGRKDGNFNSTNFKAIPPSNFPCLSTIHTIYNIFITLNTSNLPAYDQK